MAYFQRLSTAPDGGGRFRATEHTGGGWNPAEQHIAPTIGLVTHCLVTAGGGAPVQRLAVDILGVIGVDEVEVTVATVRPGRTIELVEATVTWAGRDVVRARAWRLAGADTAEVASSAEPALPARDELPAWDMSVGWPGGYIASLELRHRDVAPGRAQAWLRSRQDLVEGEEVGGLARFLTLADTANGLVQGPERRGWFYPNVDLTAHLFREPTGPWVGMDTAVSWGPGGHGLTATVLHDDAGPVGRVAQLCTLRRPAG
ncbi:thioesterase family protein [Klenkia terrae]|uniref:Thioesterase family protein n=1 Tax=Klenkia terrae TaxID=1052259 RepID=A0ABU8E6G0_9ACTN